MPTQIRPAGSQWQGMVSRNNMVQQCIVRPRHGSLDERALEKILRRRDALDPENYIFAVCESQDMAGGLHDPPLVTVCDV